MQPTTFACEYSIFSATRGDRTAIETGHDWLREYDVTLLLFQDEGENECNMCVTPKSHTVLHQHRFRYIHLLRISRNRRDNAN